ncbi:hypothetical protein ISU02_16490 [Fusibacter sp. Q10-2]|uniref:Uncharacterized protein n=1 Tax=Fusibacter ferrireducens TaxID=2785058 RepID=A0ABR9ZX36_9FIRM|nr:hypothetical protein [Fusibacter ferrireducens]
MTRTICFTLEAYSWVKINLVSKIEVSNIQLNPIDKDVCRVLVKPIGHMPKQK